MDIDSFLGCNRIKAVLFLGIFWGLLGAPVVLSQSLSNASYYKEVRERLHASRTIEPLDQNIAGDEIDYYSGTLSFSVTDIAVPGNFDIPVQIRRTLTQNADKFHQFGDWELDLPRIVGKFNKVEHFDCQDPYTSVVDSETGNANFPGGLYHSGFTFHDGSGYAGHLFSTSDGEDPPFAVPAGYKYYTKNNWIIRCSGENFIAVSPTGITYTLGSIESEFSNEICINNGKDCITTRLVAARVTKIEDRFGNNVTYNYDARSRLKSITSSDLRSITVEYDETTYREERIDRIIANGRTWTYLYKDRFILNRVVLPDNKAWVYELYDDGCEGPCQSSSQYQAKPLSHFYAGSNFDSGPTPRSYTVSVMHPEGAKIDFHLKGTFLHRFGQGLRRIACDGGSCQIPSNRLCSTVHCLGRTLVNGLERKVIHYNDSETYEWNFQYSENKKFPGIYKEPDFFQGIPINNAVTRQTTTISGPEKVTEIVYHRSYDWKEGAELSRTIKKPDGTVLQSVNNTWTKGPSYGALFSSRFMPRNTDKEKHSQRLTLADIELAGSHYYSNYSSFNLYGLPQKLYEYNDFSGKTKYTKQLYQHDTTYWLLNLPTKTQISAVDSGFTTVKETTYYSASGNYKSLPNEERVYDSWVKRYASYHADGNPKRIMFNERLVRSDGAGSNGYRYREFANYKRGKPRLLTYPARYSETATISERQEVDDNGWITSITDLNGNTSGYTYDAGGRLESVDLPDNWLDTYFQWTTNGAGLRMRSAKRCALRADKSGCSGTPAYIESVTYDHMLRPLLTEKTDVGSGERRYRKWKFNAENKNTFQSYWSDSSTEAAGITSVFDGLNRLRQRSQSGGGTQTTDYLAGNRIRVNSTRGYVTTTTYEAYGAPAYETALTINSPEGVTTNQTVNLFGDITAVAQTGPGKDGRGTVSQTEYRAYDSNHHLCKIVRNDVGQTVVQYSLLGEIRWRAEGVSGGGHSDCASTASSAEKVLVHYDNLGGAWKVNYPDASPDVNYTRDPQGNLRTLAAGGVVQNYNYNSLHLLEDETLNVDNLFFTLDYIYNDQGHLSSLIYPDSLHIDYAPNGFGEPTQVSKGRQPYASNVNYYPNGAIDSFAFGNGIVHKTSLNGRQLPSSIQEYSADVTALHLGYQYDSQANITKLTDYQASRFSLTNLSYDGLERLIGTVGNSAIGSNTINYDGLGNITRFSNTSTANPSTLDYQYDTAKNLLKSVSGSKAYSFQYDGRGNVTNNGSRGFSFNRANQLVESESNRYLYDGHNRRVRTQNSKGISYAFYNRAGRLMYRQSVNEAVNYIYLGSKLVAKDGIQTARSQTWQHYKPFGETIEAPKDEVGYTGHKYDTDLSLTYMQARYYDPVIGRFYSNDPVGYTGANPVMSFNRYMYANNNPYKYVDPDGKNATNISLGTYIGARLNGDSHEEAIRKMKVSIDTSKKILETAVSMSRGGPVIDVAEVVVKYTEGESITEKLAEMGAGEIAGEVVEKVAEKKLGKEATEAVSAVASEVASKVAEKAVENISSPADKKLTEPDKNID